MNVNIINPTREAIEFVRQWNDPSITHIAAHTSGTTGTPKEIYLSKSDMVASARATCSYFSIGASSVMVCPLSASYIAGKMMIVRAIISGATLYFEPPSSEPLIGVRYPPIDLLPIVPAQIPAIAGNRDITIKNIIVGGAPISPEMERLLAELPARSFATYGMTETCSHIALRPIGNTDSLYYAMPGISFTSDCRGCLVVNASGYSFGSLTTNDIVALHSPISFSWLGRTDNVIITGGIKVHPEQLEKKIAEIVDRPFYITSAPDARWGSIIVICMEGMPDYGMEIHLAQLFHKILPTHERPRRFKWVRAFNYTPSGKLLRND